MCRISRAWSFDGRMLLWTALQRIAGQAHVSSVECVLGHFLGVSYFLVVCPLQLHVFTGICRILGYARFSPNFFPPPFDRKIEKISYKT